MRLSTPWSKYLDIITIQPVKKWRGFNSILLSAPWADSIDIIALQTETQSDRDQPNRTHCP